MKITKIKLNGKSMSPTLKDGVTLLVHLDEKRSFSVGDIVSFIDLDTSELTTHRLLNKNGLTKGDSSFYHDGAGSKKLGLVLGFILDDEMNIYWGQKGQPLKRALAYLSNHCVKTSSLRHLFFILLIITSRISLLFCLLTKRNHNKELQLDDPSQNA